VIKPLTFAETLAAREARRGPVLRFINKRLQGWLIRHRHPFNFAIHLIGIPMALTGVVLFVAWLAGSSIAWYWGVGAFVLGYVVQFVGHLVEGNDVGEWAGIKRLFGLPYVGISPRWQKEQSTAS
jgi:uncharacterized membrane protein YGL010W